MAEHVEIVEMAARDGLQNEKRFVPTADKIALINRPPFGLRLCPHRGDELRQPQMGAATGG
ncbi:hypothetical protein C028_02051 [Brucella abortus 63/168]|nr:hypothetical protein C028_02051 [Brucella abortus 63/168]